jgi:hypothetical protein
MGARVATTVVQLPRAMMLADLARSGLDDKDTKRMRLTVLTASETEEVTGKFKARAVKIPYLDARGRDTGHFRLRFLDDVRGFGARKPQRYWQAPDTEPRAYLAPGVDWAAALADPARELWVTEGEKKAAAACKAGIACVGLGGVWSWRSARNRQPLIADLALVQWKGRRVVLAFDTDADPNPLVVGALETFGHVLEQRGAQVGVLALPLLGEADKTGLDDFLVARGAAALRGLEVTTLASGAELVRLNDELVVVEQPSSVLHLRTGALFSSARPLIELHYAHRRVSGVDAAGRLTEVNAVAEWLRWPHHRVAPGVAFEPGEPRLLDDGRVNLWAGWAAEPRRGDVSMFLRLVDYVFTGAPPEHRRWFLQWLAYPVRNPGAKLYAACVFWGRDTGTGKSLLGYTVGRVYGPAFAVVTEHQLHGAFNAWQANKQFVLGEEITGSDRRAEANRLKHVISGETATVNRKYQAEYEVRNCANFTFTSNHHDAFIIEDRDRRFFVHEVGAAALERRPPERWFTRDYDEWYKGAEAPGALMHYLLGVDLAGFDPRARAPETAARGDMVAASGGEADHMVRALLESPEACLRIGDAPVARDLFTVEELWAALDGAAGRRLVTPRQLSGALRRAGVAAPPMTRTSRGRLRLWPVRDRERWERAPHAERAAHYDGALGPAAKKRGPKF